MVIFAIKLLNNLRKAIAGRRYPHQLAGGVALGVLLGIIPHGNLLAVFVLIGVLCFRVNHAMLAVVAIGCSFGAKRLDPISHRVGDYLLRHPTGNGLAVDAWDLPLVPWTDLNNTVVAGSFVIGLAAVLPVFYLTLPLFKMVAPVEADDQADEPNVLAMERVDEAHAAPQRTSPSERRVATLRPATTPQQPVPPRRVEAGTPTVIDSHEPTDLETQVSEPSTSVDGHHRHSVKLVEPGHDLSPPRYATDSVEPSAAEVAIPLRRVTAETTTTPPPQAEDSPEEVAAVETRIDVIRMKDFRPDGGNGPNGDSDPTEPEQPMDEALNYLLRQLRNSQQRKAG
ncbi:MAG: TIGR03546 family protein [Planctomycetota bacterium]